MTHLVLWGHRIRDGANTLAYVWEGYAKAARRLGLDVVQVDDAPASAPAVQPGAIVFAEGQEDKHLPRLPGVTYVLHNCDWTAYHDQRPRCLALQVYTHDCLDRTVETLAPFVYYQRVGGCLGILYQPWATDLLPEEFRPEDIIAARIPRAGWVGTVGEGRFGNVPQLAGFRNACAEHGMPFEIRQTMPAADARVFLRDSQLAPTIVGAWQQEKGYLPCRAWKNASYGHPVLTNSLAVVEAMGGFGHYAADTAKLFHLGVDGIPKVEILAGMRYVQAHHTFVNRLTTILKVIA